MRGTCSAVLSLKRREGTTSTNCPTPVKPTDLLTRSLMQNCAHCQESQPASEGNEISEQRVELGVAVVAARIAAPGFTRVLPRGTSR
jgi:hypothetical protein